MKLDKKFIKLLVPAIISGVLILVFNFLLFKNNERIFDLINIFSFLVISLPIFVYYYFEYVKRRHIEDMFAVFMRDFVENIRGGLTVPHAFKLLSKNNYRELTPYIKKMATQLDWGIPLEDVLIQFSKEVKSKNISRIISSVIESHRYGGNLADTFQALSQIAAEIDRLRKERKAYLQSQMMTGYIIFFVFLGVMAGLEKFLVPALINSASIPGQSTLNVEAANEFKSLFRTLVVMQGFFAGIAIGKITEGSEIAGLKHSIFMMFIGGLVFTIIS